MLYGPFHLYHICGYVIKVHERMHNVLRGKKDKLGWGNMVNTSYTLMKMPLGILLNLFSFKF